MSAKQFQLPKITGAWPHDKKPGVPNRDLPPPIPGRQPTRIVSSPGPERPQLQLDQRHSFGSPTSRHRIVDIPTRKKALLKLNKKDVGAEILEASDIAKLVTEKSLPLVADLKEKNTYPGCSLELPKGMQLQLHFLRKTTSIYATDHLGKDIYLPIVARQEYTVLPIDPVNDDRLYPTTEALINSKPLPVRVRIEEAHFSDNPGEAQEVGDIIEITGVEKRRVPSDSDSLPEKCLIGTCNDVPIAFSQSMDCASYSTMPSVDFMSLSEVVKKFPLPLRIRRADKPDHVMILHRKDEEYHVIATCANSDHVLSIPISWDGKIKLLENTPTDINLFRSLLTPLYPLVNATWGVREPGRRDLQTSMQLIAQPPKEILDPWSRTKEGQDFVLKATKTTVETYKLRIEELMEEKTRLNNELKVYRLSKPPAPLPREASSPLLPPKPCSPRSPPSTPGAIDEDEDAYEEPMILTKKGKSHIPASKQLEELKNVLQERERKIKQLSEKQERLKKENTDLDNKNASLVEHIRKLQMAMDKLEAAGDPTYDSLDTNEYAYPNTGPIYSQGGGVVVKGIKSYNVDSVATLLREMRLETHVSKFKENCINGELLCDLTEEDLYSEIGMSRIQAKRLIIEVKKRNNKF